MEIIFNISNGNYFLHLMLKSEKLLNNTMDLPFSTLTPLCDNYKDFMGI